MCRPRNNRRNFFKRKNFRIRKYFFFTFKFNIFLVRAILLNIWLRNSGPEIWINVEMCHFFFKVATFSVLSAELYVLNLARSIWQFGTTKILCTDSLYSFSCLLQIRARKSYNRKNYYFNYIHHGLGPPRLLPLHRDSKT